MGQARECGKGMTAAERVATASAMTDVISGEIYFNFNLKMELLDLMRENPEAYDEIAAFFHDVKIRRIQG